MTVQVTVLSIDIVVSKETHCDGCECHPLRRKQAVRPSEVCVLNVLFCENIQNLSPKYLIQKHMLQMYAEAICQVIV